LAGGSRAHAERFSWTRTTHALIDTYWDAIAALRQAGAVAQ
jgi:hypothetical protein